MAALGRQFHVDEVGGVVRGPGRTAVATREHSDVTGRHLDLGYVLRLGDGAAPVVWDCAGGTAASGQQPALEGLEGLENMVRMWRTTTASAVVELIEGRGLHGDHVRSGIGGWSAVQGPACVFGFRSGELGDWVGRNRLLPHVATEIAPRLDPAEGGLHGVRFFFGGRAGDEVAEVRVDGEPVPTASAALRALDWPRGERLAWARCFVLLSREPRLFADAEQEPGARSRDSRPTAGQWRVPAGLLRRWLSV
jgi:hypothetical protein